MPLETDQQHYLSVIITQAAERQEEFTPTEQKAFLRFLRRMPEMTLIPKLELCRNMRFWTVHTVPAGQPLFPTNNLHCILAGKLGVFRFTTPNDPQCNQGQSVTSSFDETSDWLQIPAALLGGRPQSWERVGTLETPACFKGGETFGPVGDGWLVADESAEVLAFPLVCIERMKRKMDPEQSDGFARDVDFLSGIELFRNVPQRLLLSMLEEFIERHEAMSGEDPLGMWPGLCILRRGQLKLTLKQEVEHAERRKAIKGVPGAAALLDRSAWLGAKKSKKTEDHSAKPLCTLEAGDAVGEETLLGGTGFSFVCSSEVVSVNAEFWVLPQAKQDAAERMGLVEFLAQQREPHLRSIERKIDEVEYWRRFKKKTLEQVRAKQGNSVDDVRTPINPMPKPSGGMLLSWADRP